MKIEEEEIKDVGDLIEEEGEGRREWSIEYLEAYKHCKSILFMMIEEEKTLNRMYYKGNNVHRRTCYWQKVKLVRRHLSFSLLLNPIQILSILSTSSLSSHQIDLISQMKIQLEKAKRSSLFSFVVCSDILLYRFKLVE
eukprot:TRINITY_DN3631_c0_g1_i2.p1 TRINITY_DN3631_c0_g1~~TRINITY_DN3631_c0_g1_i2.p1  ORF type:complete len:139 (+),score=52.18 TRINITY_DN3631_c0_g1_i2:221-637(+)